MGCSTSLSAALGEQISPSFSSSRYFHFVQNWEEASLQFEAEGTFLELRVLLDYPIARQYIIEQLPNFPSFVNLCFHGWLDIQSFNAISDSPTKETMARSIARKYVAKSSFLPGDVADRVKDAVASQAAGDTLSVIFSEVQSQFFWMLHEHMFLPFKSTAAYLSMCRALRRKYNSVKQNDFEYRQVIGRGGYGAVCEVIKKSTSSVYAMKLQRKSHLASVYGLESWRADIEKQAIARCSHPFIVELFFAFQTPTLVAMVMTLCTGRDLSRLLRLNGPFSRGHVQFYAAEVTSALSYLHSKGFIYRDLKPANIMLNKDGHIMLVDFGGVVDVTGHTQGKIFCRWPR
jgi:hypothetical protein